MNNRLFSFLVLTTVFLSCSSKNNYVQDDGLQSFTVKGLENHIKILSSDDFQGRRPFTEGEKNL